MEKNEKFPENYQQHILTWSNPVLNGNMVYPKLHLASTLVVHCDLKCDKNKGKILIQNVVCTEKYYKC